MDLDKIMPTYESMKKMSPAEICWLIRNITYYLVSYNSENDKGPLYDGSYDQTLIEQATRMQQTIRNNVDVFGQIFDHRIFEDYYFEDLLSNNYYSKLETMTAECLEYKQKADLYDEEHEVIKYSDE